MPSMHSEETLAALAGDVQYEFAMLAAGESLLQAGIEDDDIANLVTEGTLVHARSLLAFFLPTRAAREIETEVLAKHYAPSWSLGAARAAFHSGSRGLDLHATRVQLNVRLMHLSTDRVSQGPLEAGRLFDGVAALHALFLTKIAPHWQGTFTAAET